MSTGYQGDIIAGAVIRWKFNTTSGSPAVLTSLLGSPVVAVFKGDSTSEEFTGAGITVDFDSLTGLNHVKIDTSADGAFYAAGNDFQVILTAGTVGGTSVANTVIGEFSIQNRTEFADIRKWLGTAVPSPSTAGIPDINAKNWAGGTIPAPNVTGVPLTDLKYTLGTISPAAAGSVSVDWGHVVNPTSTVGLTGTTVGTVTTVTNQLTAAAIAAGVWRDAVAGDFTVAGSAGISIFTGLAPGNTLGGLVCNNATASFSAFAVNGSTTLNTLTVNGAVLFGSTWTVTGATTFTAGPLAANAAQINGISTSGVTTVDAVIGTPTVGATATAVAAVQSTVDTIDVATSTNLDVAVSTRMATYVQPTGFLTATFSANVGFSGTPGAANGGLIAGSNAATTFASGSHFIGTVDTVTTTGTATNLTNAPTNGDFTAPMKASLNAATPVATIGAGGITPASFAPSILGTIATVASASQFIATGLSNPDPGYVGAYVEFTGNVTTALKGIARIIVGYTASSGTIVLTDPTGVIMAVGDTFQILGTTK